MTSQKHDGWVALPTEYDDGGFTGGNMERPALKRLLADIEAGQVDVILVYKVDRLSRSLMDFAQLAVLFEKRNVAFVSVTQRFDTTSSMGRLTLNILLSFAQFERDLCSERTPRAKNGIVMSSAVATAAGPMLPTCRRMFVWLCSDRGQVRWESQLRRAGGLVQIPAALPVTGSTGSVGAGSRGRASRLAQQKGRPLAENGPDNLVVESVGQARRRRAYSRPPRASRESVAGSGTKATRKPMDESESTGKPLAAK